LGTWSKIIHHCLPLPGPLTLLKVDTTSAFRHLTSKPKEIEYCDEYQSSLLRSEISPQSPQLTTHRKTPAVVSVSLANNESYGSAGSGVGRINYAWCEFTGKHYGYHGRYQYDHDRCYREGQFDGTTTAPNARRSTCMFEQMPVSELAVMMQGRRQLQSAGRA
jgi:hypothetical protein